MTADWILIRIPHQMPASIEALEGPENLVAVAAREAWGRDDSEASADYRNLANPTPDDALEYLGHDLHSCYLLYPGEKPRGYGHQAMRVQVLVAALRKGAR